MPDQFTLSPAAWTLLDLLQQHLGVSLELFDTSLRPLAPSAALEGESAADDPTIAAEAVKSLRTGDVYISRAPSPVGIFPLRISRRVVGCLIVSRRRRREEVETAREIDIEAAGHLVRTALESDLTLTGELGDARHRTRRLHGILRFLVQLGPAEAERDVMNAVLQAASVWFDVDCRIYQQDAGEGFVLAATLPGAEGRGPVHLEAGRAERLLASRRFPAGDDESGVGTRGEEVLVIPVGGPPPEWILLLSGAINTEVDLTFSAIARVLASDLRARELARVEAWQQRLASTGPETRRAPERVLLEMLQALAAETGATTARVALVTDSAERALAALGQAPEDAEAGVEPPATEPPSRGEDTTRSGALGPPSRAGDSARFGEASPPSRGDESSRFGAPSGPRSTDQGPRMTDPGRLRQLTVTVETGADTRVTVALTCPEERAPGAYVQLRSWVTAVRPWLIEAVAGLSREAERFGGVVEPSPFERRIQEEIERAKRFNLGLGLVLIGPERGAAGEGALDALADALRSELRASDLLGRIRQGFMALLLVHSESGGAESVALRVRQRLQMLADESPVAAVQLGQAIFTAEVSSAEALIERALAQAQRFELRN